MSVSTAKISESLLLLQNSEHLGVLTATLERITEANDAFLKMVGYTREELEAGEIDWIAMTPPELRALDERGLEQVRTQGACIPYEKEYILRDGTRLPILIGAVRLSLEPLEWVCWVANLRAQKDADAAERKSEVLRAELDAELRGAFSIYEISTRLLDKVSFGGVLNEILDTAIELTNADYGTLQLLDDGVLRVIANRNLPEDFLDFFSEVSEETTAVCSAARHLRSRVIIDDVETAELLRGTAARNVLLNAGIRSVQSTPLLSATGEVYGMLSTHSRHTGRPTERALRFLDLLAGRAGHILEKLHYGELERKEAVLRASAQLANSLAHEINNPVQALTNILSLLAEHPLEQAEAHALIEAAREQVARVSSSLGKLLSVDFKASQLTRPGLTKIIDHMRQESSLDARTVGKAAG